MLFALGRVIARLSDKEPINYVVVLAPDKS